MPFDSYSRYPKEWRDKITEIVGHNEGKTHAFIDALSWELWKFEIQRKEHTDRVQRAQFIKSSERLTDAITKAIDEIKYLQGSTVSGAQCSDFLFDAISEAKKRALIRKNGRQFLGYLIVDLHGLTWAATQGREAARLSIKENPKEENKKAHRRSFAIEVAGLFENILQEKPSSYCRQSDGYLGKFAKVLDACLSLAGDNQGLDSLVRYAVRHYRTRFQ